MTKPQIIANPNSPFLHKVLLFATELGIRREVDLVLQVRDMNPMKDPDPAIINANPLAKVPVVLLSDGTALYDSSVIVRFLDSLATPEKRILPNGNDPKRFEKYTIEALCDGILDAGNLGRYESFRSSDKQCDEWVLGQRKKIERGMKKIISLLPDLQASLKSIRDSNSPLPYEAICVANVIWYLRRRYNDLKWWEFDGGKDLEIWYDEVLNERKAVWERDNHPLQYK